MRQLDHSFTIESTGYGEVENWWTFHVDPLKTAWSDKRCWLRVRAPYWEYDSDVNESTGSVTETRGITWRASQIRHSKDEPWRDLEDEEVDEYYDELRTVIAEVIDDSD
jgi:hypothetical protein